MLNNNAALRMFLAFTMLVGSIGLALSPTTVRSQQLPQLQTYGTYTQLSARWWQWAFSIPLDAHPLLDATGEYCDTGQYDDVWFLAGTFGGDAMRTCTIPAGKALFFPIINTVAAKPWGSETLLDLRELAAPFIDGATASCTVDGEECTFYRVRSPAFSVIPVKKGGITPPGIVNVPGNTDSLVSDGVWALVEPLPAGQHTIEFSATSGGFSLNVTYVLTVE